MKRYVGNMPYGVASEDLSDMFKEDGGVEEATVIMDRDGGHSKSFGSRRITGSAVHRFRNSQRPFRKANRSSAGRYLVGWMPEGEVLAMARSFSLRSACR